MKNTLSVFALLALALPGLAAAAAGESPVTNVSISLNVIETGPGKEILVVPLTVHPFIANRVGSGVILQGYVSGAAWLKSGVHFRKGRVMS